jgi:phosphosulfolactate synthase
MMKEKPFEFMNIPHRPKKPRATGLTMMVDKGIGIAYQKDLLNLAAEYIDIAKIAVGLSGLMSEQALLEKIAAYKEHEVSTFIGGQFLEFGIHHQGLEIAKSYFQEARRLGFEYLEVSDNNLQINPGDKYELIRMGVEDFGLIILGEVGSKSESSSTHAMVEGIKGCLNAGAWKVFVEAAELTDDKDGSIKEDVIIQISQEVNLENIIFELPGPWIKNVHHCDIHDMSVFMVSQFGSSVNLANVEPKEVMMLETLRTGVGVKLG